MSTKHEIHIKCDCIKGSVVKRVRDPIFLDFVLNKPAGYKFFCEPELLHYDRTNKFVLNTITFCLKNDNHKEVIFNQETFTFTLWLIKI